MKSIFRGLAILLSLLLTGTLACAFTSGSTGADGAFKPTSDTQLQLPPDGIFNFTTVDIPQGVTVTFKKNTANTPVYILATGDVTIAGTINVNGSNAISITDGTGGPGGFDGGFGGAGSGKGGNGIGPGGGIISASTVPEYQQGGGGGYSSAGKAYNGGAGGTVYGNASIIPFVGGSGGAGGSSGTMCNNCINGDGGGGGGGGGAILIASSGTITVTGSILANGGTGVVCGGCTSGGGGSGGAVKLIANTISANGTISATGGSGWSNLGGYGRIRLEATTITAPTTKPAYTFSVPDDSVFVANTPSLSITSIGGATVPQNPTGSYATPDITLPAGTTNPVQVGISATNIPVGTIISVSAVPQLGAASSAQSAALSGTQQSSTATASVTLSTSEPCVLMAETTFNIQTAMNYNGEKITKATVAASMGGKSKVTYITASGKRVSAAKLYASLMK
jgi:hypothetical protein